MGSAVRALDLLPRREAFTRQEANTRGLSDRAFYQLLADGKIERIGHGLYLHAADTDADIDLIEVASKSPQATLCLSSSLARHGLIDEIPARTDLALPRGKTPPVLTAAVRWHAFDKASFAIGRSWVPIEGSKLEIGMYSAERSIVDAFRLRGVIGYETATEALRNWLGHKGSSPATLIAIASELPRAQGPLRQALDVLS